MSEAFAFCAICDLFDIDIILESGIYLGRSTEIWANYFNDKLIYAIDRKLKEELKERLKKYDNIKLIEGDALPILDQLLEKFWNLRFGIFMDGPKGKKAIDWGRITFSKKNVKFFGLHDLSNLKKNIRIYFKNLNKKTFFTDEEWFVKKYSILDKNESEWDEQQQMMWIPGRYISKNGCHDRILDSYGPTIGFAFNIENNKREIEVIFPKEVKKYIEIQCNNEREIFLRLPEIEGIESYLKKLHPKIVLDVGSGIGRASIFFFKYFDWKNTFFILADGDSGERQLSGIRIGKSDFYNSLKATKSFCMANGINNFEVFNLEKFEWKELNRKPDLVYSFLALGFHWPINPFLKEIYSFLENKCLLIFGLRGGMEAKDWIDEQIKRIDYSKYQIINFSFDPKEKKGNFIVLEKK